MRRKKINFSSRKNTKESNLKKYVLIVVGVVLLIALVLKGIPMAKSLIDEQKKAKIERQKKAEAERILKEKNEKIESRFAAVLGDKKFSHDAVRADYLKKFGEALESKDYEGKSDADILHALTKDDSSAFVGVNVVKLPGGNYAGAGSKYSTREEIIAIKDTAVRQAAMLSHPNLFPEIKV